MRRKGRGGRIDQMGIGMSADFAAHRQDLLMVDQTLRPVGCRRVDGRSAGWSRVVADVDVVRSDEVVLRLPLLQDWYQLVIDAGTAGGRRHVGRNLRLVH